MDTRRLLIEIGCEELPSAALDKACVQGVSLLAEKLDAAQITHGEIRSISTPRRLAFIAEDVAQNTQEKQETFRGPQKDIALDEKGNYTNAALGFARSKGFEPQDLTLEQDGDKEYVYAKRTVEPRPTASLLSGIALELIEGLSWPRSQRWGNIKERFSRPVRTLVVLFGDELLDVAFADVVSSRFVQGHRVLAPAGAQLERAQDYETTLEKLFVLNHETRERKIKEDIAQIEQENACHVVTPQATLAEVINLCEWPTALVGRFDSEFLHVPQEIICESLLVHQRYFPIYDKQGNLTEHFVIVSNAPQEVSDAVIEGNERVVRARLDDAQFFYEQDLKTGLDALREQTKALGFHEKLGSVYDKSERIASLAATVEAALVGDVHKQEEAQTAALYAKADLVSKTVIEFTGQQGIIGGYLAQEEGLSQTISNAIASQYKPRFALDELPQGNVALAVAIADKLDSIVGLFWAKEAPTGSKDPYALRRAALGVIAMLRSCEKQPHLTSLIRAAAQEYQKQGIAIDDKTIAAVEAFFLGRLQALAKQEGIETEVINALGARTIDPSQFLERAYALLSAKNNQPELFLDLSRSYARAAHLVEDVQKAGIAIEEQTLDVDLHTPEAQLLEALVRAQEELESDRAYEKQLEVLATLKEPIDTFFDSVMVMADDENERATRLFLLKRFLSLFDDIADFDELGSK